VLLTTHYMDEAERLCDRVAIMDHGKVIALGSPRELIASLGAEHVIAFAPANGGAPADLRAEIEKLPGVRSVRLTADGLSLTAAELHTALPALMAALQRRHIALASLTTHHATLEDVFVALTGRQLRDA